MTRSPEFDIAAEPCGCPPGSCAAGLERDHLCISRGTGDIRVLRCSRCDAGTWHRDGKCIRCYERVGPAANQAA